jgi:hypothetical protein
VFTKPDNWDELSPDQRRTLRLDYWENAAEVSFDGPGEEQAYRDRIKVLRDAVELKKNPRVPAIPIIGRYITQRAGLSGLDNLYHHEKLLQPILGFHKEFQPDVFVTSGPLPGKVWDILDYKVYAWAGHGLDESQQFQTIDGEYMKADEYQALIRDPSGFWLKHYLPRVLGAMTPLKHMYNLPSITEIGAIGSAALPFGIPEVQEMLHKLMQAGNEAMKCFAFAREVGMGLEAAGFPAFMGPPFASAPFDMIGDVLRGTHGMMTDLHRRPAQVIEACETLVPIVIQHIRETCDQLSRAFVAFPLHKGADAFMSDQQFRTFYWPTLKAVIEGLNEEGITPLLFAEGSYSKRLEIIADYPKGRAIWFFDQTDMRRAREILGGHLCVMGNVPSSLMLVPDLGRLRAYCEELLELFSSTGGFILANGAVIDNTTDDHVRTIIEVVR